MSDDQPNPLTDEEVAAAEQAERDARIAELELRLARGPKVGVRPLLAAVGVVMASYVMWQQRLDFSYFFSDRTPIELGAEGDYHFDRAVQNRYVVLHGIPTSRGAYSPDGKVIALGIRDTPLMLWRPTLPTETWSPPAPPPHPDQRSFAVTGRLLSREGSGDRYAHAFDSVASYGEVSPRWVLVEGQRPGRELATMALFSALMAFAAFNLWLLVRGLSTRWRSPRTAS